MTSKIFVSGDFFDEVFAVEQPAEKRQEDSRFSEKAETDLNTIIEKKNKDTKKRTSKWLNVYNEWYLARKKKKSLGGHIFKLE